MSLFFPKFIDEAIPLTKYQRKLARDKAWWIWRSYKLNICIYLIVPITVVGGYSLVIQLLENFMSTKLSGWASVMCSLGYPLLLLMAFRLMQHFRFAPHYRSAVHEFGYNVCVGCGYWLRGLDKSIKACPECGFRRTILHKKISPFKWSEEDRQRLQAIGYDPCRDCGAIFNSSVELCPECSKQREPQADTCEDK